MFVFVIHSILDSQTCSSIKINQSIYH